MPHSAQPQHTNYWAPRTRKRHQQEHRPQRPTESSDPTQYAKGRTGDCLGPRKGTTTRRNVTGGGGGVSEGPGWRARPKAGGGVRSHEGPWDVAAVERALRSGAAERSTPVQRTSAAPPTVRRPTGARRGRGGGAGAYGHRSLEEGRRGLGEGGRGLGQRHAFCVACCVRGSFRGACGPCASPRPGLCCVNEITSKRGC